MFYCNCSCSLCHPLRFGDISLQERINQKNFEMLEAYYKSLSEKVALECKPTHFSISFTRDKICLCVFGNYMNLFQGPGTKACVTRIEYHIRTASTQGLLKLVFSPMQNKKHSQSIAMCFMFSTTGLPCFQTQTDIKELLESLGQNVVTKKRKNVEILWIAGTVSSVYFNSL